MFVQHSRIRNERKLFLSSTHKMLFQVKYLYLWLKFFRILSDRDSGNRSILKCRCLPAERKKNGSLIYFVTIVFQQNNSSVLRDIFF